MTLVGVMEGGFSMIDRVLTWVMSNRDVRKVIREVRQKHVYIVTKYYVYTVSSIKTVGSLHYCIELIDKVPLRIIDPKLYEKNHRPETNMYIKRDDFIRLVTNHAEWNEKDKKVILYYNELP